MTTEKGTDTRNKAKNPTNDDNSNTMNDEETLCRVPWQVAVIIFYKKNHRETKICYLMLKYAQ